MEDSYHHGDLPRVLLSHAAAMAGEGSPESITLRGLARRAGVTHSAPVYHFGTRRRLLTDLASEGFTSLANSLEPHRDHLEAMGNAYVAWALEHPGHYAVMWQPRLLDNDDPALTAARERTWLLLTTGVDQAPSNKSPAEHEADTHAAFALVHGLASIWLSGTLNPSSDPETLTAMITRRLTLN